MKQFLRAVYRKTLGRRRYLKHCLKSSPLRLTSCSLVIDVGASHFFHPRWWSMLKSGSVTWLAIDPDKDSLEYCATDRNLSAEVHALGGVGVAPSAGKYKLNVTNVPTGSSLLPIDFPVSARLASRFDGNYFFPCKSKEVVCETLEEMISRCLGDGSAQRCVWIKLDVQGLEHQILNSFMRSSFGRNVIVVESECSLLSRPLYEDATKFHELSVLLEPLGFELVWIQNVTPSRSNTEVIPAELDVCFMLSPDVALGRDLGANIELINAYICYDLYSEALLHISAVKAKFDPQALSSYPELESLSADLRRYIG